MLSAAAENAARGMRGRRAATQLKDYWSVKS